jgi:hypothetical protein
MTNNEQAAEYIAQHQKLVGLALLIIMRETNIATCNYSQDIVGKDGEKYRVITSIEKLN